MFDKSALEHPWLEQIEASLFLQRLPKRAIDKELAGMLEAVEKLIFSMSSPYAWVVDLSHIQIASASQRKLFTQHEKRTAEQDQKYNAGSGLFADSAFTRGLVTATFWMVKPSYPTKICSNLRDAEIWARAQLRERGVNVGLTPTLSSNEELPLGNRQAS